MDRQEIKLLLREVLGNVELIDQPNWVSLRCPLATWKHATGKDAKPSAGVSVHEDEASIFNCYTCHTRGPITHLLTELEKYTGEDYRHLKKEVDTGEVFGGRLPDWGVRQERTRTVPLVPLEEHTHGDLYDSAAGHVYLRKRGISRATAQKLGLVYDPADSAGEPRILFPVRGLDGLLYGYTGRAIYDDAELKVRDYFGLKKAQLLLGAHLLTDAPYVCLSEGLFDYASLHEAGEPGAAFMSSTLTPHQVAILSDIGKPVYIFHDNDVPGVDARDKATNLLCKHLPVMHVVYPKRLLEMPDGRLRAVKDPGELTREEIIEMRRAAYLV